MGTAFCNNKIRRNATEPTGVVTRYTGVRPNNNSNNENHAALVERFQPSTLHELRQLGIYPNTVTPDTAHQLDAEAVAAEVVYAHDQHAAELFGRGGIGPYPKHLRGGHAPPGGAKKAALIMKETVFCSNMMLELDFDKSFDSVPLYIDNTSAVHVTSNQPHL